ncbi:hypothetical protein [Afipia sp. DC4300-2b1]|uniref:hypothetical protein n=1 Tax=Afipia sp. DC4300-2b1 TaxID=2804672 RepID=UPI003CF979DE
MRPRRNTLISLWFFPWLWISNASASPTCEDREVIDRLEERLKCASTIKCSGMGFENSKAWANATDEVLEENSVRIKQERISSEFSATKKSAWSAMFELRRQTLFGMRSFFRSFSLTARTVDYNPARGRYECRASLSFDRDTLDAAFLWTALFGVYADEYAARADSQIDRGIDPMPEIMDGVRVLVAYQKRCMSDTRRFALQPTDSDVLIVLYPGFYVPGCMPTPASNKTESFLLGVRN